jgi:hypothetical protein
MRLLMYASAITAMTMPIPAAAVRHRPLSEL